MMDVKWKGVYPAVTTKFDRNGALDVPAFQFNIEKQLEAGVDAIVLGGTLGESSVLENDEKSSLIQATKEVVGDKIPVIMNIAEGSTQVAINAATQAKSDRVDGLMLLPPMRYSSDHRETVEYFKSIASATDLPIMIYNNPVDYKTEVTLDMFQELTECPTIQAVKESTRDISNVTRMINRFGDRFKILSGVDTLALESLCLGADGWVAGLVCAFPKETVAIYRLMKAGRLQEALEIYRWFLPLLELDINAKLVQNIKLAEKMEGVGTEWVRAPRLLLDGDERAQVIKIVEHGIATRPALPDYMNL